MSAAPAKPSAGLSAPARPAALPRVTILLATCNGARHLDAQLQSYLDQSHRDWALWASDDGSTDSTRAILEHFRDAQGQGREIRILEGPRRGPAANFLSLLTHPELPPGPVALSDQDDVWLAGKISRALRTLARHGPTTLYGAQSFHTDAALKVIGRSMPPRQPPSFGNALVQNIVSGHSAVLSPGALSVVRAAGPVDIPFHDWWLYQLISGAGGEVIIDHRPVLLYRQHGKNAMGAHRGPRVGLERLGQLFDGTWGRWIGANTRALARQPDLLTPEARAVLEDFMQSRATTGPARAATLARNGMVRQSPAEDAALRLAAILGRI